MSGLHFGEQFVPYEQLIHTQVSTPDSYFRNILDFCRSYLRGDNDFYMTTSGSTGVPKKIALTRNQLQISAKSTATALSLTGDFKALVCISTDHIGGKMMLVRGMELGMELFIVEPTSNLPFDSLPLIDFVALVPTQLRILMISEEGRVFLSNCRVTIIGGGSLNPELEEMLDQFPNPVFLTFGMTETASHIATRRLNGLKKQTFFKVLPGINISQDKRGCLVIRGRVTNNQNVVTNDLVELVDEESFIWLDRIDGVINSGGFKILPSRLTPIVGRILKAMKITDPYAVIGLPDPKWGQRVTLVIESKRLPHETTSEILLRLSSELLAHEVPKSIESIDLLPRTLTGKVDLPRLTKLLTNN